MGSENKQFDGIYVFKEFEQNQRISDQLKFSHFCQTSFVIKNQVDIKLAQ